MSDTIYLLKLKTQKVQSFIFKVPKLKSMLGANSLLGEFFSEDLPDLRKNHGGVPKFFKSVKKNENYKWESDDIFENFKNGVIASAGGHFEAVFCDEKDATNFLKEALKKANQKLPGVGISHHLKSIKGAENLLYKDYEKEDKKVDSDTVKNIDDIKIEENFYYIDSPFFYPSEKDGENPELLKSKDNSMITKHIETQGEAFYNQKSNDYLAKFYAEFQKDEFYKAFKEGKYKRYEKKDLSTLKHASLIPNNNMIAIIATDGNGMGNRFSALRRQLTGDLRNDETQKEEFKSKSLFEALIEIEKFWFKARNGFRVALKKSIEDIAGRSDNFTKYDTLPFVIMMLGGDDLLVVSVPELAFDFVTEFNKNLSEAKDKITSCSGIAFVKHNYPFSHAHELSESLLDSAKKLSKMEKFKRGDDNKYLRDEKGNKILREDFPQGPPAVDWHFQYSSLYDDIEEIRKRDYLLTYETDPEERTEVLSMRPYFVDLDKDDKNRKNYLGYLIEKSKDIYDKYSENDGDTKGRNKYKKLRELIKEGKEASEHYINLFLPNNKNLFKYECINNNIYLNKSLDIIEMLGLNERGDK